MPKSLRSLLPALSGAFVSVFLFLLSATSVHADKVEHLYDAAVPVESQSETDRSKGFRAALEQVLIKVSGRESEVVSGQLADKFPAPLGLVQSYGYRENPEWLNYQSKQQNVSGPVAQTDSPETATPSRYLLDVMFASSLFEQQMLRLSLPIWGDTRPSVLVWALVEQKGERQLIGNGDLYGLSELLLRDGQYRGLPMYLPSADLQDLVAFKMDDLFALKEDSVTEANLRYEPDAHVLVRIVTLGPSRWSANWLIKLKQESVSGQVENVSLPKLASSLGADVAQYLSSRYAVMKPLNDAAQTAASTELLLEVDRINSFEDFVSLQHHLETLPPLSSVAIERIEGSRVFCRVQLNGTRQQLFEHIDLSGLMQLKPSTDVPQPKLSQGSDVQSVLNAQPQPERFDWRGETQKR